MHMQAPEGEELQSESGRAGGALRCRPRQNQGSPGSNPEAPRRPPRRGHSMSAEVTTGIEITFDVPADSDYEAVAGAITELVDALDALHRAKGGSGLNVDFNVNGKPTSADDLVGAMRSGLPTIATPGK